MTNHSFLGHIVFQAVLAVGLLFSFDANCQDIERNFDILNQVERASLNLTDLKRSSNISATYDALFDQGKSFEFLSSYSNHDLELLFRATDLAAFYSLSPKYVSKMKSIVNEMDRRKLEGSDSYRKTLFTAMIQNRQFDDARDLWKTSPSVSSESLPEIKDENGPINSGASIFSLDESGKALYRQPIDLATSGKIIVVAHPLCHFTQNAMSAIEADERLRSAFASSSIWIMPQSRNLDIPMVLKWNSIHPSGQMKYVYRQSQFPLIDSWSTPTFYFIKNNKLVYKVVGWPEEGHGEEILAGLKALGI